MHRFLCFNVVVLFNIKKSNEEIIVKKLFDEFLQRPLLKSVSFQLVFVMNCKSRQHWIRSFLIVF